METHRDAAVDDRDILNVKQEIIKRTKLQLEKLNCPGALIRIDDKRGGSIAIGVGHADLNNQTPMPEDGQFYIYSPTKTYTAVCILKLIEENKLQLEHLISDYFSNLEINSNITIKQLLNHTAGLVDYYSLKNYHEAVRTTPSAPWTTEQYLNETLKRGQEFPPGENWRYSNTGYLLLLLLIEKLTKSTYSDAIGQLILKPLNLKNTYVTNEIDSKQQLIPGFATLNSDIGCVDIRALYHPGWCATGVIVSTTYELIEFYKALFAYELINESSLSQMIELIKVPGNHPPAVTPSYGLGIMSDPDFPFGQSFGHGGSGPGYNVWVEHFPNMNGRKVSLCIVYNKMLNNHTHDLRMKILELIK